MTKLTKQLLEWGLHELNDPHGRWSRLVATMDRTELSTTLAELHDLLTADERAAPPAAIAKFVAPDWEYMTLRTSATNEAPCVRRLRVEGGFLYQVAYQDSNGKWHPPTFVPTNEKMSEDQYLASIGERR